MRINNHKDIHSGKKSRKDHPARAQGTQSKGKRTREEHDTRGAREERAQVGSRGEYNEKTGQVLDENLEERKRKLSYEEFPNDLVKLDTMTPAIAKTSAVDPTNKGPLLPIDFEFMKEQEREKQREQAVQNLQKTGLGQSPSPKPKFIQNANISRPPSILKTLQMTPQGGSRTNSPSSETKEDAGQSLSDNSKEKHVSFDDTKTGKENGDYVGIPRIHTPRSLSPRPRKEQKEHQHKKELTTDERTVPERDERRSRDKTVRDRKGDKHEKEPKEGEDTKKKSVLEMVEGLLSFIDEMEDHVQEDEKKSESVTPPTKKSDSSTAHTTVQLIKTPFGLGELLQSEATHCLVKLPTMNAFVKTKDCVKVVSKDPSPKSHIDLQLASVRAVRKADLPRICELETESYPPDEAAPPERLYYRFIYASDYFKVLTYCNQIVGFVCGTLANSNKLTEESILAHVESGKTLCVHSVVVDKHYRRNKLATLLMKKYLQILAPKLERKEIHAIRLMAKKHLVPLYQKVGFVLEGKSNVQHGKDQWYEMVYA
ncbi:hypothetical protein RFI_07555 [Reticulomyxa filosa]|uniref:N-acetyltransferase domain-containing protein n=1 Tax=Reticulomyxa filosa TaxID=46433 RepID=X6NUF6_RETFI|nr:hypothetical protein RFI_07555 [Reticulomyxa filosa]|eukprot:ETO29563.1 hypothetical protein RFI_07555 [Reticulomyxa filosa]